MPRLPRRDFPGACHHVMARGIERRRIFADDEDRAGFLRRLARLLVETGTLCFAFALMSNHYHLVLQTASTPLALVMRRLGTGHAMAFNRRHRRVGYLFQNRFKSRLVDDTAGLLSVVRYVHLNPVRAGMVESVSALAAYPWTGHAALMGRRRDGLLQASAVLSHFADDPSEARRELARWMQAGLAGEEPLPGFDGAPGTLPDDTPPQPSDETGELALEREVEAGRLRDLGWDLDGLVLAVCAHLGVDPAELRSGRRTAEVVQAREAIAGLGVGALAESRVAVARAAGVTRQAAAQAFDRFDAWTADRNEDVRRILSQTPPRT